MSEHSNETPQGYRNISEEDQKKAQVFFDRGNDVAGTGNFDYAIEMYLQGLNIDPDSVEAHKTLREYSLKRKASGGKSLGMMEAMRLKRGAKDEKQAMLNAEKLLAYDPGNTDAMLTLMQAAHRGGYYDTVLWIGPILKTANTSQKKPEYAKFHALKEIYKDLQEWQLAVEACQAAASMKPDDMDLQTELKHLGAYLTMSKGKYATGKSFRASIRDAEGQQKLINLDKDVITTDAHSQLIAEAEAEWKASPNEPGKFRKYIDALIRTEQPDYENKAIELLEDTYNKTRQFNYRMTLGKVKLAQLTRMERSLRASLKANPGDENVKKEYTDFLRERAEEELAEYSLWLENYPTDSGVRYEVAKRLFILRRFTDAIPMLQQVRNDPKYRVEAGIFLGRSFLEAGYVEEAVDTLRGLCGEYELQGDEKSKLMNYWAGRALEEKGDLQDALGHYSKVAQWDFNYTDVQARIKEIRAKLRAT